MSKENLVFVMMAALASQAAAQIYDTNDDVVEIFAGSGTAGLLNAQGTLAMFNGPQYVVSDTSSNLYVWDSENYLIRKITPSATVSTFASGFPGYPANGLTIDGNNTLWLASPFGIYEVSSNGSVTDLTFPPGAPSGICTDSGNNIYFTTGDQVYRISAAGVLTLFAGNTSAGSTDGQGIYATFNGPQALASDQADNIYVWDAGNARIRRIDQNQNVCTIAGNGSASNLDGVGTNTGFALINAMCGDNFGNIWMACGNCIRKMTASTNVVTIAGSFYQSSYANGAGALARFDGAQGVCLSQGGLFVADRYNQRVRQISFNPQPEIVSPANLQLSAYPGLTVNGFVGRTYQIQSSANLSNWTTEATLLLTGSPYLWFDLNPIKGNKFYRAILLP